MSLDPGSANSSLTIDDSGDATGRSATLTPTALTGMGMDGAIDYQNIGSLNITMGQGNDTFTLDGLAPATTAATIDGGPGKNTFSAQIVGDFAADLTLLDFSEVTSFTINGDLRGEVVVQPVPGQTPGGQIDSMQIQGSITATGVIQATAIESLSIGGNLAGSVSESSSTVPGSLSVGGSITGTAQVSWVGPIQTLTVGQDVAGTINNFTTISDATIGGSLTATGSINAHNINDLAIEQVLAGRVTATGYLDDLTVGSAVTGSYSASPLGNVVVNGVTVHTPTSPTSTPPPASGSPAPPATYSPPPTSTKKTTPTPTPTPTTPIVHKKKHPKKPVVHHHKKPKPVRERAVPARAVEPVVRPATAALSGPAPGTGSVAGPIRGPLNLLIARPRRSDDPPSPGISAGARGPTRCVGRREA